jgi:hypothetical protein
MFAAGPGCGSVTIRESAKTSGTNQDSLAINGVNVDQLWFRMSGNNLEIDIMGSTDHITLNNCASAGGQLLAIEATNGASNSSTSSGSSVAQLVQATASFSANHPGFDPTSPSTPTITASNVMLAVNADWHP